MSHERCPSCGRSYGCDWEDIEDIETCHICNDMPICEDCYNNKEETPDIVQAQMGPDDHCVCGRCVDKIELRAIPTKDLPLHVSKKWRTDAGKAAFDAALKSGAIESQPLPDEGLNAEKKASWDKKKRAVRNLTELTGSKDDLGYLGMPAGVVDALRAGE